jgi:hypothetical protein
VQLLLNNEMFGPRVNVIDLKLAKNVRFKGNRLLIGLDMYNIFNSDAISSYITTFTPDNPATPQVEPNSWLNPLFLIPPRFIRGQIAFSF